MEGEVERWEMGDGKAAVSGIKGKQHGKSYGGGRYIYDYEGGIGFHLLFWCPPQPLVPPISARLPVSGLADFGQMSPTPARSVASRMLAQLALGESKR